jgi:subtilisin family serine protease
MTWCPADGGRAIGRRLATLAVLVAAAVMTLHGPAAMAGGDGEPGFSPRVDDRVVVRLRTPEDPNALDAFIAAFVATPGNESLGLSLVDAVPNRGILLLDLGSPEGFNLDGVALQLESGAFAKHLLWGEFLYLDDAPEGADGTTGSTYVDSIAPPSFHQQYARPKLGLDAAQTLSRGAGVVVAVLDTGVDPTHPVLAGAVLPGVDFVDGDLDANDTADGIDQDGDGVADELFGHGTFVAGMIRLVAPDAMILPIRVLDDEGRGDGWAIIRGMFAAIDRGPEVINVSIRSTYNSQAVEDAADEAESLGIAVVAAAGNFDLDRREFPAAKSAVIGVVALDELDRKADFSSYNDKMFISAPGDTAFGSGVPDPSRSIIGPLPGGDYGAWEGTSFATPLVAGAAALIRGQHPEWPADITTATAIRTRLELTAVDISAQNPAFDPEVFGVGRMAVGAAVGLGPAAPAVGDLDGDGTIGFLDLTRVLSDWGLIHSSADVDGSGRVDLGDLLRILSDWS